MTFKEPFHFKNLDQIKYSYFATRDLELKKHNAKSNEDLPWRRCLQMNFIEAVFNALEEESNLPTEKANKIATAVVRLQKLMISEQEYGEPISNAEASISTTERVVNWLKSFTRFGSIENSLMYTHNDEIIGHKGIVPAANSASNGNDSEAKGTIPTENDNSPAEINDFTPYENECLLELRNYLFSKDKSIIAKPNKTLTKEDVIKFITKHITKVTEAQLPYKYPANIPSEIRPIDDKRKYPLRGFNEIQMIKILHDKQHANLKLKKVETLDRLKKFLYQVENFSNVLNHVETKDFSKKFLHEIENFSNVLNHVKTEDKSEPLDLYKKEIEFNEKAREAFRRIRERSRTLRQNNLPTTQSNPPTNTPKRKI